MYDFSGLTTAQRDLLTFQGWWKGRRLPDGSPYIQPTEKMVQKLIDRGLVVAYERHESVGPLLMVIKEYEVPIPVHMAWCEHCAQSEPPEARDVA